MTKSDWTSLGFYVLLFGFAFISFASQDMDTLIVLSILTMTVAAVHGTRVVLRSRQRNAEWNEDWESPRQLELADEMDIHRVLDIDQRLEALERAETRRHLGRPEPDMLSEMPEAVADVSSRTRQRV